ncbi:MAG TPA: Ig-like domain-containing protein [Candidatus Paceibacterota bacterium]
MRNWFLAATALLVSACSYTNNIDCTSCGGPTAPQTPAIVMSVQVLDSALAIAVGATRQLSASVVASVTPTPANLDGVVWRSAAPSIASVSASGLLTALSVGATEVRAYARADSAKYARVTVNVRTNCVGVNAVDVFRWKVTPLATVTLNISAGLIGPFGEPEVVKTVGCDSFSPVLRWLSSNAARVLADPNSGKVRGLAPTPANVRDTVSVAITNAAPHKLSYAVVVVP